MSFQNGGQMTDFYFVSFQFWRKFEKTLSQRNFSTKFWLIIGDHEYITIAEIKIGNSYSAGIFSGKTIFQQPPEKWQFILIR